MSRIALRTAAPLLAFSLAASACFVSIDESKIQEGTPQPAADASDETDALEQPDVRDASREADAPDAHEADAPDAHEADAPDAKDAADETVADDATDDADAGDEPDVDNDVDTDADEADAADEPEADEPDAAEEPEADEPDAADEPEAEEPDAADEADASDDVSETGDADASVQPDAPPLVECRDDSDCPPVNCASRTCLAGACVADGVVRQDVGSFDLPAPLACSQTYNASCIAASRGYLVALTDQGLVVFNTRNPKHIKQETVPDAAIVGYNRLVRSGDRIWAAQSSSNVSTPITWLDLPFDGVSPVPMPKTTTLFVAPSSALFAAPNDALFLYGTDPQPSGYFARFTPGFPTSIDSFPTTGATEFETVATSIDRAVLHAREDLPSDPPTYQHRFSVQTSITSPQSANGGAVLEPTIVNLSPSYGYFAASRNGSVAWLIARGDGTTWNNVLAFWLVTGASGALVPSSSSIEDYTIQPSGIPEGPIAFINDTTIAAAVISGGSSPTPSLTIVSRTDPTKVPKREKRIPTSPLAPGPLSVTGDSGFAYVVSGTKVRMFVPACNP